MLRPIEFVKEHLHEDLGARMYLLSDRLSIRGKISQEEVRSALQRFEEEYAHYALALIITCFLLSNYAYN